jgi:hypothetical protein
MSVKQRAVAAAIKGARAAGVDVARVVVDADGSITIIAGKPIEGASESDPLDAWMAKHASSAEGHQQKAKASR